MSDSVNKTKKSPIASVFEWVEVFCMALFVVVLLFTFVCRLVTVDGASMNNTLQHGDRMIISDLFYTPHRGDVVVVQDAASEHFPAPIIKRVIATEGEKIDIDPETWTVTVTDVDGNEIVLDEPYVNRVDEPMSIASYDNLFHHSYQNAIFESSYPYTVPKGHVFVMGDNRENSTDSRMLGQVDKREILGKVIFLLTPGKETGMGESNTDRIGVVK